MIFFCFLQTVSILEERLTMTENKLKECLDNQQQITLQIQPNDWPHPATTPTHRRYSNYHTQAFTCNSLTAFVLSLLWNFLYSYSPCVYVFSSLSPVIYNACYVCTMYCQRMCKAMNVGTGSRQQLSTIVNMRLWERERWGEREREWVRERGGGEGESKRAVNVSHNH